MEVTNNNKTNFSLIITFKCDQRTSNLDNLRLELSNYFGGNSILDLPPHMTLIKWYHTLAFDYSDLAHLIKEINSSLKKQPITIYTQELELNEKYNSVWLNVNENLFVSNIQHDLYLLLKKRIDKIKYLNKYKNFHITLAYKDYSLKELDFIFSYIQERYDNLIAGVLIIENIHICQRINKNWNIVF